MAERRKHQARVYLRRSTGKQESGVYAQLEWAIEEARRYGVELDADKESLDHMLKRRLPRYKDIYLDDGITGADLTRPGFTAFRRDALADQSISHLFIHMPDRFSRAELGSQAMNLEQQLLYAGLTVVFSNRVSKPRRKGETYVGEDMQMFYSYVESGDYLNKLAVRVIQTQVALAKKGHWTGGQPPYGIKRVRVFADGTEREMERRTSIRQPGSHTEIRPTDAEKIRVWVMELDWCERRGWGCKRIAKELNTMGIPSPDAGRTRTENGRKHRVSEHWTPSTVRALLRNTAITGVQRYGVQSEGHHRRLGENGPRQLEDHDQLNDEPRVVANPESLIIRSAIPGFKAPVDVDSFKAAQAVLDERGKHQKGIAKTKDPSRYPLCSRVYDMNCGYPMYGVSSGERRLYRCGRYINSDGRHCDHNQADAEATLACLLGVLRQRVLQFGKRARLREKLLEIAKASAAGVSDAARHERQVLEARVRELEHEVKLLETNLGRAADQVEYDVIRKQFHQKRGELEEARSQLERVRPEPAVNQRPDAAVDDAMQLFDQIELIASDPEARDAMRASFQRMNLNVWLSFMEGRKGSRPVRQSAGGVITAADHPLPVEPYGGHAEENEELNGDRPLAGVATGLLPAADDETSSAGANQQEGVSLSKVHRGDKI